MVLMSDDEHFRQFGSSLERNIARYDNVDSEETLVEQQKRQIETLVVLEEEFRQTLIAHRWGVLVYRDFVRYICDERRNILAARPYFRERQDVFAQEISKALKKRADRSLYRFHFNYQFVSFVMKGPVDAPGIRPKKWAAGSKIARLARQINAIREELVVMNVPLAISRARTFWSRTPRSKLAYMDLIQIASEGLIAAVDKFCLPYSPVFRSVAIGRMVGNFIEEYSSTDLHFYPGDRRKLYRANKAVGRMRVAVTEVDFEKLAQEVNQGAKTGHDLTTASELAGIMAAASCVSSDMAVSDEPEAPTLADRFAVDPSTHPDAVFEREEALAVMRKSANILSPLESKVLRLRGVTL